jgi:hypothetical protein
MSNDSKTRGLEREFARDGDEDTLDRLKVQWLRSIEWRECPTCMAQVPTEIWDDHQDEHVQDGPQAGRRTTLQGGMRVVQIPESPAVASRPVKMPLYDHEYLEPGQDHVYFFSDTSGKPLWRTNLPGAGGEMPQGWCFFWYGVSLVPDASARPEDVLRVWDRSSIELVFGQHRLNQWPARELMTDQPTVVEQEAENEELRHFEFEAKEIMHEPLRAVNLRSQGPVRNVTISGKPIQITSPDPFRIELRTEAEIAFRVGLMLVLYGLPLRAITG